MGREAGSEGHGGSFHLSIQMAHILIHLVPPQQVSRLSVLPSVRPRQEGSGCWDLLLGGIEEA